MTRFPRPYVSLLALLVLFRCCVRHRCTTQSIRVGRKASFNGGNSTVHTIAVLAEGQYIKGFLQLDTDIFNAQDRIRRQQGRRQGAQGSQQRIQRQGQTIGPNEQEAGRMSGKARGQGRFQNAFAGSQSQTEALDLGIDFADKDRIQSVTGRGQSLGHAGQYLQRRVPSLCLDTTKSFKILLENARTVARRSIILVLRRGRRMIDIVEFGLKFGLDAVLKRSFARFGLAFHVVVTALVVEIKHERDGKGLTEPEHPGLRHGIVLHPHQDVSSHIAGGRVDIAPGFAAFLDPSVTGIESKSRQQSNGRRGPGKGRRRHAQTDQIVFRAGHHKFVIVRQAGRDGRNAKQVGKQEPLKGRGTEQVGHVPKFAVGTLVPAPLRVQKIEFPGGTGPTVAGQPGFAHEVIHGVDAATVVAAFGLGDVKGGFQLYGQIGFEFVKVFVVIVVMGGIGIGIGGSG